jgi:hypothetical protein
MNAQSGYRELAEANSYDRISDSSILASNWLGPCIGSVVNSCEKNIAYVGHFGSLPDSLQTIIDYIRDIKSEFGGFDGLKVTIRGRHGVSDMNEMAGEYTEAQRSDFLSILTEGGFSEDQMDVQWGEDDYRTNLMYDANRQKVREEKKLDEEFFQLDGE